MGIINPLGDLAHKPRDFVVKKAHELAHSKPVKQLAKKWEHGEKKLDRKFAKPYAVATGALRRINNFQWKHRDAVERTMRVAGPIGAAGALLHKHFGKPKVRKISTRGVEYGAASFADDAAYFGGRAALAAQHEPKGEVLAENPFVTATGVIVAAGIHHQTDQANRKIKKGLRWVRDNPGKTASLLGTGAAIGAVAMKAMTGSDLPYNQGGAYSDPYFRKEEQDMSKEKINENPLALSYGIGKLRDSKYGQKAVPVIKKAVAAPGQAQAAIEKKVKRSFNRFTEEQDMEKIMSENIRCAIDRIAAEANQEEARDMIHSALGEKILGLLDTKKADIAKVYFSGVPPEGETDGQA